MLKKIFSIAILFFVIFPKQIKADMAAPGIWMDGYEKGEVAYCTYMFKTISDLGGEPKFLPGGWLAGSVDVENPIYIGENTCSKYESNDNYQISNNETYSYESHYFTNLSEEQVMHPSKEYAYYSLGKTVNAKFDDAHDYPIIYSIKSFYAKQNDLTSSANCNLDEEKVNCSYTFKEVSTDKYNEGVEIINNTCSKYEDNPKYRYIDGYGGQNTGGKTFCSKKDSTDYTFNEMHQIITNTKSQDKETIVDKKIPIVAKTNNYQKKSILYIGIIIFIIIVFSLKFIFYLKKKNKLNKKGPKK